MDIKHLQFSFRMYWANMKGLLNMVAEGIILVASLASLFILVYQFGFKYSAHVTHMLETSRVYLLLAFFTGISLRYILKFKEIIQEKMLYLDIGIYFFLFAVLSGKVFFKEAIHQLALVHGAQLHGLLSLSAVGEHQVALPLGRQLNVAAALLVQQAEALFRLRAGVVHPDDKIHPSALAQVQQARFVRLGGDLHDAVAVQIPADQRGDIAQGRIVQLTGADLLRGQHLLAFLIKIEQHRGQIVARKTGPAVQHQIALAVRSQARRHSGAARELICRKAHDSHLLEHPVPVNGQQLNLHPAVLQRGHQDQILVAAAGDILHQILLIGLFQNGIDRAVLVGVHRQIAVALRGEVPHHQLGCGTILQLCQL